MRNPVAPVRLGQIERPVGGFQQLVLVEPVVGRQAGVSVLKVNPARLNLNGESAVVEQSPIEHRHHQTPTAYYADVLLRPDNPSAVAPAEAELRRGEVDRTFLRNPTGDVAPADRTYLGQLVMRQTGLPEADAATRVETVVSEYRTAVTAAQEAAEKARKFALLLAFAVAATLAISAGAAWWAAIQGGEPRDQGIDLRPYVGGSTSDPFRRNS